MILPPWISVPLAIARRVPLVAWVGLLAVVFAISSGHYRHQRDESRKDYAAHLAADAAAINAAKAAAKAAELKQAAEMAAAQGRWAKDKADALEKQSRVIDQLRAGTLRLQKRWRGCQPGAQAPAGAEGSDAAAADRGESAGRIVRAAADADGQITYLQSLIRSAPACFVIQE